MAHQSLESIVKLGGKMEVKNKKKMLETKCGTQLDEQLTILTENWITNTLPPVISHCYKCHFEQKIRVLDFSMSLQ
jgi:hypothetical protein